MSSFQITNPYQDPDFANYQLKCGKAKAIEKVDGQIIYFFHLFQNYTISYTNQNHAILKTLAKKHNSIYTLIEDTKTTTDQNTSYSKKIKEIIPRFTSIIDLRKTEEEILKNMHSKGRYNIRLAEKHKVTIQESNDIQSFYNILKQTAQRDKFYINPESFYYSMHTTLHPQDKAKLFLAFHTDIPHPIAGILNTYLDQTATYYYGASDHNYRKYMAPYLLQWHAIQDAKNNNFQTYDFLGIANPNNSKDTLKGVTDFKNKFGGTTIQYQPAQIIIHKPLLYSGLKIKNLLK